MGDDGTPAAVMSMTIAEPSTAAAILGVLAALVIALNISTWSIRSVRSSRQSDEVRPSAFDLEEQAVLLARYRVLAEAAVACGAVAVIVGLATVFSLDNRSEFIASGGILFAGAIIAVISVDTSVMLRDGPDIDAEVQRYRRTQDASRLRRALSGVWSTTSISSPKFARRGSTRWWVYEIGATVLAVASVPALIETLRGVVEGRFGFGLLSAWVRILVAAALVVLVFATAVYMVVTNLVNRDFLGVIGFGALSVMLFMSWLLSGIFDSSDEGAAASWGDLILDGSKYLSMVAVLCVIAVRAVGSAPKRTRHLPGSWLRWLIRRHFVNKWASLARGLRPDLPTPRTQSQPPVNGLWKKVKWWSWRFPWWWVPASIRWYRKIAGEDTMHTGSGDG
ncbi:hypothetical protein [Nocardia cyriacigeorgica]|uniref:hypothetical protein n=1 Tax=Nocardia cyriacigeorgica TaxID=135487 RepID=UPI0024557EE7|nr:hypothetical protein [Nocardia cyriacigeorgica]